MEINEFLNAWIDGLRAELANALARIAQEGDVDNIEHIAIEIAEICAKIKEKELILQGFC